MAEFSVLPAKAHAALGRRPGAPALPRTQQELSLTSGTLVPYDIIYDLTLSFTVYDIICDSI
jgi:hypothetical protein